MKLRSKTERKAEKPTASAVSNAEAKKAKKQNQEFLDQVDTAEKIAHDEIGEDTDDQQSGLRHQGGPLSKGDTPGTQSSELDQVHGVQL